MRLTSLILPISLSLLSVSAFAQTPVSGELIVSEMMFNPGPDLCVTDENGEWFEVTNVSNRALDLNGLSFTDVSTSSPTYFQVLPSVATIPLLYPGQTVVFCRTGALATNGGITTAYPYLNTVAQPVDRSQVGPGAMNMGNSGTDGIRIFDNIPPAFGGIGVLIEEATYVVGAAPLTGSTSGISVERKDLFASMVGISSPASNSANLAKSTASFGACAPLMLGTPGLTNSTDITTWLSAIHYIQFNDSLNQNTGTLLPDGPASIGNGTLRYTLSGGPLSAGYSFGYAPTPSEVYLDPLYIPGNPGAILVDLTTASFLNGPAFTFDGAGNSSLSLALPNNPLLVGQNFVLQWLALDVNTFTLIMSNGLSFTMLE